MKINTMAEMMANGETPEILFWVGCAGSFDQRAQKITKAFATILTKVGLKLKFSTGKCFPKTKNIL
mgnify:CR=1 FL=1